MSHVIMWVLDLKDGVQSAKTDLQSRDYIEL
jgi:hypothetical protein